MARRNFLYVDIKVYPASVEFACDMDTILIADQPILATHESIGLQDGCWSDVKEALAEWIDRETLAKGKELLYKDCPKAPK